MAKWLLKPEKKVQRKSGNNSYLFFLAAAERRSRNVCFVEGGSDGPEAVRTGRKIGGNGSRNVRR